MSEYTIQADNFLAKCGVKFKATATPGNACPMWCDGKHIHGDQYRITMSRNGARFTLMFWNSLNDRHKGNEPRAYDILACIQKSDPGDFERDFCADFDYDSDSRKALKTYKAVRREWEKVEAFFTPEEIEELQEIS